MPKTYDELLALAEDAKPRPLAEGQIETNPDDDWGSDRQCAAENLFFEELKKVLPNKKFIELEEACLKATTEEMLEHGLHYARAQFGIPHPPTP